MKQGDDFYGNPLLGDLSGNKDKYKLRILAGKHGMDNVISWVHMLEDETIISRFGGEELAVTTGMKSEEEGWLIRLVMAMKQADCTGIIVNTGMYLKHIPKEVISWCEDHDFPLLETPWEISITELTQEYCCLLYTSHNAEPLRIVYIIAENRCSFFLCRCCAKTLL